ncbi:MAG: hypothetical protein Q7K33_02145 [Candidatus Berkelbacteria bacterium]|nr:hypothetical protein [Candidatus Berkelbacteria bacterium]
MHTPAEIKNLQLDVVGAIDMLVYGCGEVISPVGLGVVAKFMMTANPNKPDEPPLVTGVTDPPALDDDILLALSGIGPNFRLRIATGNPYVKPPNHGYDG